MTQSFNDFLATKYGIEIAVIISVFDSSLSDLKNGNRFDNTYWIRCSIKDLKFYFPYFTTNQIRRYIDKMVELGIIKKSKCNLDIFDQTSCYSFTDSFIENNLELISFRNK